MTSWIVVFSEIVGYRWVLENQRMAFSSGMAARAAQLRAGDRLFLYVARGAFHNPNTGRAYLGGSARVTSPVHELDHVVLLGGREFVHGCAIQLDVSFPEHKGVPFHPLVPKLEFIGRKDGAWGNYLRPGLVVLSERDASVIQEAIAQSSRSSA